MNWKPPSAGLRVFPLLAIVALLLVPLLRGGGVRLPAYTRIPLPRELRAHVVENGDVDPAALERERSALRRRLLRGQARKQLSRALEFELARGRPGDALGLIDELGASLDGDSERFLAALAHYERAQKFEHPWQDERDLEACVELCAGPWDRSDFDSAAEQLSLWAELALGVPERAHERVDPIRQPDLWRRLRDVELLQSGPWGQALAAAGDDRERLHRLRDLRPGSYSFWGLNAPTWDALIAVADGNFARADTLAEQVRARIVAIPELPELGAAYERLLARWVDERPADRSLLEPVRRTRIILFSGLDAETERELEDELLPALHAADLEGFAAQIYWIRGSTHERTQPELALTMAERMVESAERFGDPYLLDMALNRLHAAWNNLPDVPRAWQVEARIDESNGRYGFDPRRELRTRVRSALRVLDDESALAAATAQLRRSLRAGDRAGRFTAHVDRSYVELMRDHVEASLEHSRKAGSIAASLPALPDDMMVELELAEIVEALAWIALGDDARGLEMFARIHAREGLQGGRQRILARLLEAQARMRRGEIERAGVLLARADSLNLGPGYRDYRWRIPFVRGEFARQLGESGEALRLFEIAWRNRRGYGASLAGRDLGSQFLGGTRELAERYLEQLLAVAAPPRRLLEVDQAERALRWGLSFEGLPRVAAGEVLLQFRVLEECTLLWCVDASRLEMRQLAFGREQWARMQQELEPLLSEGTEPPERYRDLLGHDLLAGLDAVTNASRVRVAPAAEMAMLPWSLLGQEGKALCATREVTITPVHRAPRSPGAPSEGAVALFAYAGDGTEFLLPGVETRARTFAAEQSGIRSAIGAEATPSRLAEEIRRTRALILVGHAGSEQDGTPYFQLAPDSDGASRLHPENLAGLDLTGLECVVLVGCGTARDRGGAQSAPGFGLAGAFLGAGVHRVYASVVPLPDAWDWTGFAASVLRPVSDDPTQRSHCFSDFRFLFLQN